MSTIGSGIMNPKTERVGRPRLLVLATGGTIAGRADSAIAGRYASGEVGIDALLAFTADLGIEADLVAEPVAAVGSQDMDAAIWDRLHGRIAEVFANDQADGVIVTHGTDTAEETAFLLDLVLPPGRPVVLVGAMRPANVLGADGPRNLANAIRVAGDPASYGRGVLVVLGDAVFGARDVRKALTSGTDAFRAVPGGPLATVSPASLRYFAPPVAASWRGRYRLPPLGAWPPVAVLYAHANMDMAVAHAILSTKPAGVVLAGVGHGNASAAVLKALAGAAGQGVSVVRSTHLNEGTVTRNLEVDDDASHFIAGGSLNPQKCRILLQLLIADGVDDIAGQQRIFDGF